MAQIKTAWTPARVLVRGKDGVTRTMKASKRTVYPTRKGSTPAQARDRGRTRKAGSRETLI